MVYDCFSFYNELDLLEIRLNELDAVVDKFVLVESTVTHTNKPKPLYYQENKKRFKKFNHKIIHIVVKDSPDISMTWVIERHQLSAVVRGLKKCNPNDTILYSCVDEIPRAAKVKEWINKKGRLKAFLQDSCYYFLNYVNPKEGTDHVTRMFKYKDLKYFKDIYLTIFLKPDVTISDGGWHFSYMGGIKKIQQKLASFAHQELNNDKFNTAEKIQIAMMQGKDPFGMGWHFITKDISTLPEYVQKNQAKFHDMILYRDPAKEPFTLLKIKVLLIKNFIRVNFLRKIKRRIDSAHLHETKITPRS